jgi:hypothetical protein
MPTFLDVSAANCCLSYQPGSDLGGRPAGWRGWSYYHDEWISPIAIALTTACVLLVAASFSSTLLT